MLLNYRNVEIHIDDRLQANQAVLDMAREYIDARFLRPVMVWNKRLAGTALRLAIPEELIVPIPGAKTFAIRLEDCVGTIIRLDGWKRSTLTDDVVRYALRFWYEPVYVDMAPDGTPWIDD